MNQCDGCRAKMPTRTSDLGGLIHVDAKGRAVQMCEAERYKEVSCTWVDCKSESKHAELTKDGNVWANLCDKHHTAIEVACKDSVPHLLAAWVKAQGGAKKAAQRM